MSDARPILQYRVICRTKSSCRIIAVHEFPYSFRRRFRRSECSPVETGDYSLTRTKAFAKANALNALNGLPIHSPTTAAK